MKNEIKKKKKKKQMYLTRLELFYSFTENIKSLNLIFL